MRRVLITTPETPQIVDDQLYNLLREEKIDEFNSRRSKDSEYDLSGLDFRGLDLRGLDTKGVNFENSYFRQANLAGLNLSHCRLEGASIRGANISGVFFPMELTPEEIVMSLNHGTRMRYNR